MLCFASLCCDFRLCIVFHIFVFCFTYLYCVLHICVVFCMFVLCFVLVCHRMSDPSKKKSNIFQESLLIVKGQKNTEQQSTNSC